MIYNKRIFIDIYLESDVEDNLIKKSMPDNVQVCHEESGP